MEYTGSDWGRLAQLGERCTHIAEVTGSNPVSPTNFMKLTKFTFLLAILVLHQNSFAGAWDVGPFDNDEALDWVWELEASTDLSVVRAALNAVASEGSYIEGPTGSTAIAAAEVVAALLGKPRPQLPLEVKEWASHRSLSPDSELIELARKVIADVQDLEKSELAQLWSDTGEHYATWKSGLSGLLERLQ